jgi:serine protease Do
MGESTGQGSGIIMSKDGYIITNAHVVEGADGIKVVLDNSEEYEATLVGKDTKTDLAVIKIKANNLTAANFGDSSQMEVGETVIAIGNPSGLDLAGSVTQGIVSAVDRLVKGSSGYSMKCIQTDAAINPGNSGGALVNQYGQVIGINSAKIAATEYEGIGFSIPMNEAKPIIDNLIKYGYIKDRARLGISFQMIDEVYAKIKDVPTGLYIKEIDQTTDTYKKGVRVGDIVTKIDGKKITDADAVSELLKTKKPGQTVKLTVYRLSLTGGNPSTFDVTVALGEDRGEATNNQQSITP